jgi:hypothetical protein
MKTINLETIARFNEILTTSTGRAPAPTRHCFLLIPLVIVCLWTSPKAQAVVPPPDGGYPRGNTAEGYLALGSLTTGAYNTAVGIYSVLSLTDGNFCTGIGAGALLANTADENTATGAGTLLSNSTGVNNTANGAFAETQPQLQPALLKLSAALLIVQNRLRSGLVHFKLCTHFLQARSKCFNLLLQACDGRFLLLIFSMLFEKLV